MDWYGGAQPSHDELECLACSFVILQEELQMKENVGSKDRAFRTVAGSALMVLGYRRWGGNVGHPAGLLSMMAALSILESAVTRVCPLNALFRLDTREPRLVQKDVLRDLKRADALAPHILKSHARVIRWAR